MRILSFILASLIAGMLLAVPFSGCFRGGAYGGETSPSTRMGFIDHNIVNITLKADNDTELLVIAEDLNLTGNGTADDPISMSGLMFADSGLRLGNTTLHLNMIDCSNISFIELFGCGNVSVINTTFSGNSSLSAVAIRSITSDHMAITNCTFKDPDVGISVLGGADLFLMGNSFTNCGRADVQISTFKDTEENGTGISGLIVEGNLLDRAGLELIRHPGFMMENLRIENNTIGEKKVHYYHYKDYKGEVVPSDAGQIIVLDSKNLTIKDIDLSGYPGMTLIGSSDIDVIGNTFGDGRSGIDLHETDHCFIAENIFENCSQTAVVLSDSSENRILRNTMKDCEWSGLLIDGGSFNNRVAMNDFQNCSGPAIDIERDPGLKSPASGNLIFRNSFMYNNQTSDNLDPERPQVICEPEGNFWNLADSDGNHWSDLTSPDTDSNGIVDQAYVIGPFSDNAPLIEDPTVNTSYQIPIVQRTGMVGPAEDGAGDHTFFLLLKEAAGEGPNEVNLILNDIEYLVSNFSGDIAIGSNYTITFDLDIGTYAYHYIVDSRKGSLRYPLTGDLSLTIETPPVIPVPLLSDGQVDPSTGAPTTKFTFSVTYTEINGMAPDSVDAVVKGMTISMDLISGDPKNGSLYQCTTYLGSGEVTFYFKVVMDGINARFPSEGTYRMVVGVDTGELPPEEEPVAAAKVSGRKVGLFGGIFSSVLGALVDVAEEGLSVAWEVGGEILEGSDQVVEGLSDGFHKAVMTVANGTEVLFRETIFFPVFEGLDVLTSVLAYMEVTTEGVLNEVFKEDGLAYNIVVLQLNLIELLLDIAVAGSRIIVLDLPASYLILDDISDIFVSLNGIVLSLEEIAKTLSNTSTDPIYSVLQSNGSTQLVIYIPHFSEQKLRIWVNEDLTDTDTDDTDGGDDGEVSDMRFWLAILTSILFGAILLSIIIAIVTRSRKKKAEGSEE